MRRASARRKSKRGLIFAGFDGQGVGCELRQIALIVALDPLRAGRDSDLERRALDGLAAERADAFGFRSLAEEGGAAFRRRERRVIEIDEAAAHRNAGPALDQGRVALAVGIAENPLL